MFSHKRGWSSPHFCLAIFRNPSEFRIPMVFRKPVFMMWKRDKTSIHQHLSSVQKPGWLINYRSDKTLAKKKWKLCNNPRTGFIPFLTNQYNNTDHLIYIYILVAMCNYIIQLLPYNILLTLIG